MTSYGICHRCKCESPCEAMVPIKYIDEEFGELLGYECEPCSRIDDEQSAAAAAYAGEASLDKGVSGTSGPSSIASRHSSEETDGPERDEEVAGVARPDAFVTAKGT